MDAAAYIRENFAMDDVAKFYGFQPNRGGYIACPFHGEKTPSLKIYTTPGRGWHCYGCGAGGTAIDFVMQLFNIPFRAAVVRLNADFCLGLSSDRADPMELEKLRMARLEKEKTDKLAEERYTAKAKDYRRLWDAMKRGNPDDPEYAEACKRLPILEEWFAEADKKEVISHKRL